MYCDKCGGVLFHEYEGGRGMDKSYCRKCNPKVYRITSINNPDLDISLEELKNKPGVIQEPVRTALDGLGNPVIYRGSHAQMHVPGLGPNDAPPSITNSDGTASIHLRQPTEIFRTVETKEELPETGAAVGQITFVQKDETLRIWDGEEWTNMGDVARELRTMRNNAHNRRAEAIAATRRKREERGEST